MSSEQRLARRQGAGPVRPSLVIEPTHALVAQLDRASDFESEGREFESLRARQAKSMAYWISRTKMLPINLPLGSGWEGADRFSFPRAEVRNMLADRPPAPIWPSQN